ncbi:MAG TPA: XRE family transcriptional regulator, partial [Streptosporangiaceae bacterium]|nr:XRE family transcriptional regulator [Streptosporangiaceae bacterium]
RGAEAAAVAGAFDPDELTLARKFRGLRKNELAQAVGVTPAALSQYELGQSRPSPAVLARLALALAVPVRFFVLGYPKPVTPSAAHFRSLRATTQLERDQAIAFGQLAWRLMTGIEKYIELPASRIPHVPLSVDPGSAEVAAVARYARDAMGIGAGPVPHVVRLLEAHGAAVIGLPAMSRRVDAFSHWYGSRPLVFLNPAKDDKARSRFDAAHELGHLVLHHDAEPGNRIVENQAHDFAAEFLMPREQIAGELPRRLDWDQLFLAKRRWGVSLKALVYRAHKLGVFGESTYRAGMVSLARWGDPEPGDLGQREAPVLLAKAIQMLAETGVDLEMIARDAGLATDTVTEIVRAADGARPRVQVTLA